MDVEIIVIAIIKGTNMDQIDLKVKNRKISATAIATIWPLCKSFSRIGETSYLMAGGPLTFAL